MNQFALILQHINPLKGKRKFLIVLVTLLVSHAHHISVTSQNESNIRKYQYFRKFKLVLKHRVKEHVFIKFKLLKRYNYYRQAVTSV